MAEVDKQTQLEQAKQFSQLLKAYGITSQTAHLLKEDEIKAKKVFED